MKLITEEFNINDSIFSFHYRNDSPGDIGVISQIFHNKDYDIGHWTQGQKLIAYHKEQSKLRPSLIIDAGANIGASVVYFLKTYENAIVYSIEPEINNWHILEINTSEYKNKINFLGAIAQKDGELFLEDPGQSDWAYRTSSTPNSNSMSGIKSISPASILSTPPINEYTKLIFKVDIEGGEASLFDGDTTWLRDFPLLIIELHDWMLPFSGSSKNFLRAIARYDFDLVHRGENIFLFNREILA